MPCNSINTTLEIFTLFLMAILLAAMLTKQKKSWQDKLFIGTLFFHTLNTLADLTTWLVAGSTGPAALLTASIVNVVAYFISAVTYFTFLALIYATLRKQIKPQNPAEWLLAGGIALISVVMVLVALTNFRTGWLYTIAPDNSFTWGPVSVWYDTAILFQIILLLPLALLSPKTDRRKAGLRFLFYAGIPVMGAILMHWYPVIMLMYPTIAISLLLIYTNGQREQELELMQKELELTEKQIAVMLSQIQPHFLYNALSTITFFCRHDPAVAEKASIDFTEFLRGNMTSITSDKPISFEKELEHTKHYLELEKLRFKTLNVVFNVETVRFRVPTLTLQPIVENAVRYGVTKREEGGTVRIDTRETAAAYIVTVSDDGVGFDVNAPHEDGRTHIGIQNVRDRLAAMVGGTLMITSTPGVGTTAVITIPKEA